MELVFADKPGGVTTHTSLNEKDRLDISVDQADGFKEHLEHRFSTQLFVSHRLDRETTGAIVFARSTSAARDLQEAFAGHLVEKTYLLLTDRKVTAREFTVESHILREGNQFLSLEPSSKHRVNSSTHFQLLEEGEGYFLWQARPKTGKSHQIRLHAKQMLMPILGDTVYGGGSFPALCLHSSEIRFTIAGRSYHHRTPAPRWFEDRRLLRDPLLCRWLYAVERRERLLRTYQALESAGVSSAAPQTLRWIHVEGDPLRVDQFGEIFQLSWYRDGEPREFEMKSILELARLCGWNKWYLQVRGDRGRTPNQEKVLTSHTDLPLKWLAEESGVNYEFRRDSGLSPGLFLDQRRNRQFVKLRSNKKRVLNLFSYTGGFSVNVALGGAEHIVTVDLSRPFLEWTKENFALNHIAIEKNFEFRSIDSIEYLDWAIKKQIQFDLVICDPPSFSRSKGKIFRIEDELQKLVVRLCRVTAPGGLILFCCNFEKWTLQQFVKQAMDGVHKSGLKFTLQPSPSPDWDFELPRQDRLMKTFMLGRS
jgi:23S rRNA (cytosine1962-C5)-methyltransferase